MNIADVSWGTPHTIVLQPLDGVQTLSALSLGGEVRLYPSATSGLYLLTQGETVVTVRPRPQQAHELADLASPNTAGVAWLVGAVPQPEPTELYVQWHDFPAELLVESLDVVLPPEKASSRDFATASQWLREECFLPVDGAEGSVRAFLSVGKGEVLDLEDEDSFVLYGQTVHLIVRREPVVDADGATHHVLAVDRVVRLRGNPRQHPVYLARGTIRFVAAPLDAAPLGAATHSQFVGLRQSDEDIMAIWRQYNQHEARLLWQHACEVGGIPVTVQFLGDIRGEDLPV